MYIKVADFSLDIGSIITGIVLSISHSFLIWDLIWATEFRGIVMHEWTQNVLLKCIY